MFLPESEIVEKMKGLNFSKLSIERVLGVQWNVSTDQFGFSIVVKDGPITRRGILFVVSSVFDPFGFVSTLIHQAKRILLHSMSRTTGFIVHLPTLVPVHHVFKVIVMYDHEFLQTFLYVSTIETSEPRIEQDPSEGGDSAVTPRTVEDRLAALAQAVQQLIQAAEY